MVLAVLVCSASPRIAPAEREVLARIGCGAILFLIGIAREFQDRLILAFRRGPNPVIILLFAWSIFEFFRSPFRGYATTELMRVFDGVGSYFLCAYCLRSPRQTGIMAAGALFLGACVAVISLSHVGVDNPGAAAGIAMDYSVLGTHENLGSLLMLLFPISISFTVTPSVEEKRKLAAIAGALVIGAGLLVARARGAWIGVVIGLLVLALLQFRFAARGADILRPSHGSTPWRRRFAALLGSPLVLLIAAAAIFLVVAGAAPLVANRLTSFRGFRSDSSLTGRTQAWLGAARMASESPLLGRGLGSFEVIQGRWTHFGTEIERALESGVGDENMAHNFYLQWAADTGGVGLFLYLFAVGLFLSLGCRAIPRVTAPLQRALLLGCIGAVAAGLTDALASPGYQFHGISTLYWCIIGLGVASMRPTDGRPSAGKLSREPALDATPIPIWISAAAIALLLVACVLATGVAVRKHGESVPRGRLELTLQGASGAAFPGQTLRWTAFFHDAHGDDLPTMPGTTWRLTSSDPIALGTPKTTIDEYISGTPGIRHEVLTVVAPSISGTLTMHARYADQYGRWYDAYSMQDVRARKP